MRLRRFFALTAAVLLLGGCASHSTVKEEAVPLATVGQPAAAPPAASDISLTPPTGTPAISTLLMPEAPGTLVKENNSASIDYSNTADGYVMVRYTKKTFKKLKSQVRGPSGTTYTYDLQSMDDYVAFPLSDGSGNYKVTVYENISGNSYSTVLSATFSAQLKDEFAPFLLPNQYVDYTPESQIVTKASELTVGTSDPLKKVEAIYQFIVKNFSYDYDRAANVQSGYLPVLDSVLAERKGICFDYASLMTGMLRSQQIPTKLVIGYSGKIYHAWISVYSEESGWIESAVYFDGTDWKLMDPTFASTGRQSRQIMNYINNGKNYSAKYLY